MSFILWGALFLFLFDCFSFFLVCFLSFSVAVIVFLTFVIYFIFVTILNVFFFFGYYCTGFRMLLSGSAATALKVFIRFPHFHSLGVGVVGDVLGQPVSEV